MFGGSRINTTRKPIKAVVGGFGGLLHGHKAFPQFLNFTLDILHVRFDFGHTIPDVFQLHNHGGKLGGFLEIPEYKAKETERTEITIDNSSVMFTSYQAPIRAAI